jgi:hypothetical protein
MKRNLKLLHITNHPGTITNLNNIIKYIYLNNTELNITLQTTQWPYGYYIDSNRANDIFTEFIKIYDLNTYDILFFTDTAMYGRPFLQNLDKHPCQIIFYITNRFDWGIWNITDTAFYNLYSTLSHTQQKRIIFTADNSYDKYYAQHKGNIYFTNFTNTNTDNHTDDHTDDHTNTYYIRNTPHISPNIITGNSITGNSTYGLVSKKLFIQNRGTDIKYYKDILETYNIQYDIFDTNNRYRDKEQICEYLGILHLPYQVNIQSLWENLGYGIIHFIPSKTFILELIKNNNWYYWEERTQGDLLFTKSIELSEWYAPDLANCFIYFDTWQDLHDKYNIAKEYPEWYLQKRRNILAKGEINNKDNIAKWISIFNNLLTQKPSIVTMFYDIRSMDGDISDYHRKRETFYSLAASFILKVNIPLIICIDKDNKELIELIINTRGKNGLDTYFHFEKFENTYFYKYINRITEMQTKYIIYNGNPRHETPRYITLNNNKMHFMEQAIRINPFNSTHFIWMDMGINHVAKEPWTIQNWQYTIPDKIKQMCINPYLENHVSDKDIFHNIYHHTAGGLFSGSKEFLSLYINLYKVTLEQILNEEWYQIDEAIMTIVQREHPELFEFYYGDYEGIIANYEIPQYSIYLIIMAAEKYIRFGKQDDARIVITYLERCLERYPGYYPELQNKILTLKNML